MKEYRSRNSGRYIFNEDMHNLQDLALSPTEMFKDCGLDFVISGCKITVEDVDTDDDYHVELSVTSGYVFLGNRIRPVPAFSMDLNPSAAINSIAIYATQPVAPQITYYNGDTDYQYNDYAAEVRVNYTPQTGDLFLLAVAKSPGYEFPNLRTAFFAHYCMVNNGGAGMYSDTANFELINGNYGNFTHLTIDGVDFEEYVGEHFVKKAGDTMDEDATLTFVSGGLSTVIGGGQITTGTINGATLAISGNATINGSISATSETISGLLTTNNATINNELNVKNLTATGSISGVTLTISNSTTTGTLTVNTLLTAETAAISQNISAGGNLTVSGSATITGALNALNNANVGGSLNVSNRIEAGGVIEATGNINALSNLNVSNMTTLGNSLIVHGNTTMKNNLTVESGGATITMGGITVSNGGATISNGGLSVANGGVTIGNDGLTITHGDETISDGDLTVSGTITAPNICATTSLVASDALTALNATITNLTVTDTFTVNIANITTANITTANITSGNVTQYLVVGGVSSSAPFVLTAIGNSIVNGDLTVEGALKITEIKGWGVGSELTIGHSDGSGKVTVKDPTNFKQNVTIGDETTNRTLKVYGTIENEGIFNLTTLKVSTISEKETGRGVVINNKVTATGAVDVNGLLTVGASGNTGNAMTVNGYVTTTGGFNVSGGLSADSVSCINNLGVGGNCSVDGRLSADDTVQFDSTLTVGGKATFNSLSEFIGKVTCQDEVLLRNGLTVQNGVSLTHGVTIGGVLNVSGTLTGNYSHFNIIDVDDHVFAKGLVVGSTTSSYILSAGNGSITINGPIYVNGHSCYGGSFDVGNKRIIVTNGLITSVSTI